MPKARHRHRRLLRARIPSGRLVGCGGHDRLLDRVGLDCGAIQTADPISGHADVEAAQRARLRVGLAAVRWVHADLYSSVALGRRAAVSPGCGIHTLLRAAFLPRKLSPSPRPWTASRRAVRLWRARPA